MRTSAARHMACHSRATGLHGTSLRETTRDEIKHEGNDAIEKRGRLGRVGPLFYRTLKKKKNEAERAHATRTMKSTVNR